MSVNTIIGGSGGKGLRAIVKTVAAGFTGQVDDMSKLVKKPATGGARVSGSALITVAAGGAITLAAALAAGASVSAIATITGADLVTAQVPVTITAAGTPAPSPTPTPTPAAGLTRSTFPTAPAMQHHFNHAAPTVDGNDRLVSSTDLQGLANIVAAAGYAAPKLMTDDAGRKFLRFNGFGQEAAVIANALAPANNRAFMALMVGMVGHARSTVNLLMPRFASYTSPTVNTAANASIGYLRSFVSSSSGGFLQGGNPAGSSNTADCYKIIPGAQLHVMAIASRTTANGGTRLYVNNDKCDVAQQTTLVSNYVGAILGGAAGASNTENLVTTVNNTFDLYEIAFWYGELTNAQADANVAAAVSNFAIPQLDTNYVNEGDSITDGVDTALAVSPAYSGGLGSRLARVGVLPGNVRILNIGTSGSQTSDVAARRNAVNSIFDLGKYPGGPSKNLIALQIGRNDISESRDKKNSAMLYADYVALINTASTGYLQRGWKVYVMGNIASSNATVTTNVSPAGENTLIERIKGIRAKMFTGPAINTTFANDTLSGSGQAYDGLVKVVPLHLIAVGATLPFNDYTDANNTGAGYYDADITHLRVAGIDLAVSGGDTPAYGYKAPFL